MSPIRQENRALYPGDWPMISARIRFERAGSRCECTGQCATRGSHVRACSLTGTDERCQAFHGQPNPRTGARVVLTTMHLDDDPTNSAEANLLAGCQGCHLAYDRDLHLANLSHTLSERRAGGTLDLFGGPS